MYYLQKKYIISLKLLLPSFRDTYSKFGSKFKVQKTKFDTISNELLKFVKIHLWTLSVEKVATRMNGEIVSVLKFGDVNSASNFLTYKKYFTYVTNTVDLKKLVQNFEASNFKWKECRLV